MGCYNTWCPLCGGPLNLYNDDELKLSEEFRKFLSKNEKWLSKITILFENKKSKHGFKEVACNTVFAKGKLEYDLNPMFNETKGVPLHTDCWKYAKKIMNRECTFKDFNKSKILHGGGKKKKKLIKNYLHYLNYKKCLNFMEFLYLLFLV